MLTLTAVLASTRRPGARLNAKAGKQKGRAEERFWGLGAGKQADSCRFGASGSSHSG